MSPREGLAWNSAGELDAGAVHVWSASLDVPPDRLTALAATLSADERDRAARFRFERDRRRFVAARGTLREVLGAYLHRPPGAIGFVYGPFGKPGLAPPLDAGGLSFNLSHGAGVALYALARARPIGVDVEALRALPDLLDVARGVMTPEELASLSARIPAEQLGAFFALWTRKEAYMKATGAGFSLRPDSFAVDALPAAGWTLVDLAPAPGVAACVAVQGPVARLEGRAWEGGARWPGWPDQPGRPGSGDGVAP